MSSFFAFGLAAGKPLGDIAKAQLLAAGHLDLWQNLPILIVVLWGGFLTNFVWSAILIFQNGSVRQFAGEPGINPMRATATKGDTLVDFDPKDPSTYNRLSGGALSWELHLCGDGRRDLVLPVLLLLDGADEDG